MTGVTVTGRSPHNLSETPDVSESRIRHVATDQEVYELTAAALKLDPQTCRGVQRWRLTRRTDFYAVFRRWAMQSDSVSGHTRWIDVARRLHADVETQDDMKKFLGWMTSARRDLEAAGLLRIEQVARERGRVNHIRWELLPVSDGLDSPARRDSSVGRAHD